MTEFQTRPSEPPDDALPGEVLTKQDWTEFHARLSKVGATPREIAAKRCAIADLTVALPTGREDTLADALFSLVTLGQDE